MTSFFGELRRRNVVKVAAAYAIVAWLLIQVTATVFPILQIPGWATALVTMLVLLGFPVALLLSWAFELTPEGLKPTKSVPQTQSVTRATGQKLNYIVIVLLAVALIFVIVDSYFLGEPFSTDRDRSIAILPFENQSAAEENAEFIADGIHGELITQLFKIGALDKVISRTSVMDYRDTQLSLREIGPALGVANLLVGVVQQAGNRLRINVTLIDVATDGARWSELYDAELTAANIFEIQRDMATSIAAALQATPQLYS